MPGKIITKRNYTIDKKQRAVSCDLSNGDKISGSIKGGKFIDQIWYYQFSQTASFIHSTDPNLIAVSHLVTQSVSQSLS